MDNTQLVQLDVQGLAALVGVLIPVAIAVITKKYASPAVKAGCNFVASVIVGVLAYFTQHDGPTTFWGVVNAIIVTLIASVAAYHGVWKPAKVYNIAPQAGIGAPSARATSNRAA